MFCCKFLELTNVGPQAQFILPNQFAGRETALYIATRWENNFIPLFGNKEKAVGVKVLVHILLLGTFLIIDDVHAENFCQLLEGYQGGGNVDFMPRAFFKFTNVKRAFFNNNSSVCWETSHIDALKACDEATRMEGARKCLKMWDLLSKIDLSHEQITPVKNRMRHEDSLTEELDQYISTIKQNIIKLDFVDEMYSDYLFGNEKPVDNEWITKHAIIGVPVPPENKTIAAGEDLILHCEIGGIPTPAVIWARNGKYLFSGKGNFINWEEKNLNQGREPTETGIMAVELTIPCAQPSDSGVYSCLGNNLHHKIESSSHVVIEGPTTECPPKAPAAPKIVAWTESRAENQGLTATLVCISDIPAKWTWSFEGREIVNQKDRYEIKEHGNLMIHNLAFSDLGTYYCTASNEFGNSTAETYLHVTRSHS